MHTRVRPVVTRSAPPLYFYCGAHAVDCNKAGGGQSLQGWMGRGLTSLTLTGLASQPFHLTLDVRPLFLDRLEL